MLPAIRKEAGEARDLACQLEGKELSADLEKQLGQHSKFMYALAKKLKGLVDAGDNDPEHYAHLLTRCETAQQWFAVRRLSAKGLLSPFKGKSKSPAKPKPASKAPARA